MSKVVPTPLRKQQRIESASTQETEWRVSRSSQALMHPPVRVENENPSSETASKKLPIGVRRGGYKGIELDKVTNGKKDKLMIYIAPGKSHRPVGDNERRLALHISYCVRSIIDAPRYEWDDVKTKFLNHIWKMITVRSMVDGGWASR